MTGAEKSRQIACGIDLGTTNCAIAWADFSPGKAQIKPLIHPVEQYVSLGELQSRTMLPSALYLMADGELTEESIRLPWADTSRMIVGELARVLGPKVPGRFVISAKSWLCHDRVDRSSPILPWGAPPESRKISPVEAAEHVLNHIRQSWNQLPNRTNLEKLPLVLTVPASFDEAARRLTVEAARSAGLGDNLALLEEPQAAFYAWIADHPNSWQKHLQAGETILVCDVGGGTTDFTLISAIEEATGPGFERVAVGDHLMLGGDNMDLTLAHLVEGRLGQRLSVDQWTSLRAQSRSSKERLLGDNPPANMPIGITGKGSRVVGGSMSATVTRDEVLNTILEGFFPECRLGERPAQANRSGFQEFGLPFEQDAAVTRHLASFLGSVSPDLLPSAILFNGGALKPAIVRDRIVKTLKSWLVEAGKDPEKLRVLDNPDLDLAVARGAAYYAAVKQGGAGLRMKSGLARSLYVGLQNSADINSVDWLCVVPRDAAEGEPIVIQGPEYQLMAGRKVAFPLATSSIRPQDKPGDLLPNATLGLRVLAPLEVEIKVGRKAKSESVPVELQSQVNAIGTVDLWCASKSDPRKWQLEIGTRKIGKSEQGETDKKAGNVDAPESAGVIDQARLDLAKNQVEIAFAKTKADEEDGPSRLVKRLEDLLDSDKSAWPASTCRTIFETLRAIPEVRKKSPGHESRWLNLVGYALRPGFGQPADEQRLKSIWSLFGAGPSNPKEIQVWVEWWVLWRRLSPGLNRSQQDEIWRRLQGVLIGSGKKPDRKISTQEFGEMVRTAASLERLDASMKMQLGTTLIKNLKTDPTQAPAWLWALGRMGSRQPLYGPLSGVIPATSIKPWIDELLNFNPETQRAKDSLKLALLMIARKDHDRSLDFDEQLRTRVQAFLIHHGATELETSGLIEYQPLGKDTTEAALGESLPIGLSHKNSDKE